MVFAFPETQRAGQHAAPKTQKSKTREGAGAATQTIDISGEECMGSHFRKQNACTRYQSLRALHILFLLLCMSFAALLTSCEGASVPIFFGEFPPVKIITTSPPHGTTGKAYMFQMETSGGDGQMIWQVLRGQLPPGITLGATGKLTGTPTAPGTYTFTVTAGNSTGRDTETVQLVVDPNITVP